MSKKAARCLLAPFRCPGTGFGRFAYPQESSLPMATCCGIGSKVPLLPSCGLTQQSHSLVVEPPGSTLRYTPSRWNTPPALGKRQNNRSCACKLPILSSSLRDQIGRPLKKMRAPTGVRKCLGRSSESPPDASTEKLRGFHCKAKPRRRCVQILLSQRTPSQVDWGIGSDSLEPQNVVGAFIED